MVKRMASPPSTTIASGSVQFPVASPMGRRAQQTPDPTAVTKSATVTPRCESPHLSRQFLDHGQNLQAPPVNLPYPFRLRLRFSSHRVHLAERSFSFHPLLWDIPMKTASKIKHLLFALSGALLFGSVATTAPAEAGYRYGWGGHRHVVYRHVVRRPIVRRVVVVHRPYVYYRRPVVRRVVVVERPVIYWPRPVIRRVVVVQRPYYPRAYYGYGWRQRVVYRGGGHHRRWAWY